MQKNHVKNKGPVIYCLLLVSAILIVLVHAVNLKRYGTLQYETYDASFDAEINNYYWFNIPLQNGVWTYTIRYQSAQNLLTRVYPMNEDVNYAHSLYSIGESYLPSYNHEKSFTIYVRDKEVLTGVEVRGETGSVRNDTDVPGTLTMTYRPFITLIYRVYRPLSILLIAGLCIAYVRFVRSKNDIREQLALCLLVVIFIFISTPLFMNGILRGADPQYHMRRIEGIADGLRSGVFPVRLYDGWYNDYGYPEGIFYADLFLYIPALLRLLYLPLWKCLQIYMMMMNAGVVAISYHSFKRISGDSMIAVTGSLLYGGSVWYLTGVYLRCAVGEMTALVFLPLVALGFYLLVYEESGKEAVIPLTTGYSGMIQCHSLMPVMTALFSVILCLLCLKKLWRKKLLCYILHAAAWTCLINAAFLLPFLDYYRRGIRGSHDTMNVIQERGIALTQLLMLYPEKTIRTGDLARSQGIAHEMPLSIGGALLIGLAISAFFCIFSSRENDRKERITIGLASGLGVLAIILSMDFFPYVRLQQVIPVLSNLIAGNVQYPWRYLSIAVLLVTFAAILSLRQYMRAGMDKRHVGICLVTLSVITLIQGGYLMSGWINSSDMKSAYQPLLVKDATELEDLSGGFPVFLMNQTGMQNEWQRSNAVTSNDELVISGYVRSGFLFSAEVKNMSGDEAYVDYPVWNYFGYRASGDHRELAVSDDDNRRVRVTIPADYEGELVLQWKEPWYWRVAEIGSIAGLILFIACYVFRSPFEKFSKRSVRTTDA